ncbi:MAG: chemotaxis response regulator protein-glutamate methylesterase [Deltaproteobacteria bacterium]|nr:chemotaxis response regulator protein-glutamate methylesterase [Deltaproteobacteria bacterium]
MDNKIKVLIVDDSALVRNILAQGLSMDAGIDVVGTAEDAYQARDLIVSLSPDVITLDVEMPKMDGVDFLRQLMPQRPTPVVMVSAHTQKGQQVTLDCLEAGAVDFVAKPATDVARGLTEMMLELRTKIKIASISNVSQWKAKRSVTQSVKTGRELDKYEGWVVAIGASTGGTEAIKEVLCRLGPQSPPIVVVQHMPEGFTRMFAKRLNEMSELEVKEAENGDMVKPGRVLLAPGGRHMELSKTGNEFRVIVSDGPKVNGHKPSVEVLMNSVAQAAGAKAVGVMLTGMGGDGAEGMLAMRKAGARNIAQDEKSCVVFGMPKVAFDRGGAEKLVPLDHIAQTIMDIFHEQGL